MSPSRTCILGLPGTYKPHWSNDNPGKQTPGSSADYGRLVLLLSPHGNKPPDKLDLFSSNELAHGLVDDPTRSLAADIDQYAVGRI
jgi:hypothetical protein